MTKKVFTVPDIYPEFICKASACRRSCCLGWTITVSMEEYHRLIGLDCPPEVRRRLDGAFYMLDEPTKGRYAEFAHTYEGDCPLHRSDGICMLQSTCGEDALPAVCRYYPRSPRTIHGSECALSASCEGVCELLFDKKEPIHFIELPLEFKFPLPDQCSDETAELYRHAREVFIKLLQARPYRLGDRLMAAGRIAEVMRVPFRKRSRDEIIKAIELCADVKPTSSDSLITNSALECVSMLFAKLELRYPIDEYSKKVRSLIANGGAEAYETAALAFEQFYPSWETMFEQVLVNHIFYQDFPFSETKGDVYTAFSALAALYAVWRAAAVCCPESQSKDFLADMTADLFRMAEKSNYYLCAAALLREHDYTSIGQLSELCNL